MLEIASKLGRLATGLGDGEHRKGDDLPAVRVEVTVALDKIYGEPLPGEIVDVETVGQSEDGELKMENGKQLTGKMPVPLPEGKP